MGGYSTRAEHTPRPSTHAVCSAGNTAIRQADGQHLLRQADRCRHQALTGIDSLGGTQPLCTYTNSAFMAHTPRPVPEGGVVGGWVGGTLGPKSLCTENGPFSPTSTVLVVRGASRQRGWGAAPKTYSNSPSAPPNCNPPNSIPGLQPTMRQGMSGKWATGRHGSATYHPHSCCLRDLADGAHGGGAG